MVAVSCSSSTLASISWSPRSRSTESGTCTTAAVTRYIIIMVDSNCTLLKGKVNSEIVFTVTFSLRGWSDDKVTPVTWWLLEKTALPRILCLRPRHRERSTSE